MDKVQRQALFFIRNPTHAVFKELIRRKLREQSKLSTERLKERVVRLRGKGLSLRSISKKVNCATSTVHAIIKNI